MEARTPVVEDRRLWSRKLRFAWILPFILAGCAVAGLDPRPGDYSIHDLLPLADGNTWLFDVFSPGESNPRGQCRMTLRKLPDAESAYEIRAVRVDGEGDLAGRIERSSSGLVLSFPGLPVPLLQPPIRDGRLWRFDGKLAGQPGLVHGTVKVRIVPAESLALPIPLGELPETAVEVSVELRKGPRKSQEIYVLLPGIGLGEIRRSEDGQRFSKMRLKDWGPSR